jgi:hypothetical protein
LSDTTSNAPAPALGVAVRSVIDIAATITTMNGLDRTRIRFHRDSVSL